MVSRRGVIVALAVVAVMAAPACARRSKAVPLPPLPAPPQPPPAAVTPAPPAPRATERVEDLQPAPGLSVQWLALGGGGGIAAPIVPLDALVRARIEAAADWVIASSGDPKKPEETGHAWTLGTRTAIDLVGPAEGSVALLGSAEAFVRIHQTDLRVRPKPEAALPKGGVTGMLGVQLRLR